MSKTNTHEVRITAPGMVKVGDTVCFTLNDKRVRQTVKLVLDAGTDREELIYNKSKNYYLITSMCIAGTGSQKDVTVLRDGPADTPEPSAVGSAKAAVPLTDEQIIERARLAGFRWLPPSGGPSAYPGVFDVSYMEDMRRLLATVLEDREHAENYRLIRRGQHWSVIDGIGNTLRGNDLDAAVMAIRAAKDAPTPKGRA